MALSVHPNDGNDWDANHIPVLIDTKYGARDRKLMLFANKNGFYYVLDRETGEFLNAVAICAQNWNDGFSPDGRPLRRSDSIPSPSGTVTLPGAGGGANWSPPAYNPLTGLFYVKVHETAQRYFAEEPAYIPGRLFFGGHWANLRDLAPTTKLCAVKRLTGEIVWEAKDDTPFMNTSGVLATASGLVFTGDGRDRLLALDAESGEEIWRYQLGAQISMAPITYLHEGSQELAVISGGSLFVFRIVE